jgi:hypothetical protein
MRTTFHEPSNEFAQGAALTPAKATTTMVSANANSARKGSMLDILDLPRTFIANFCPFRRLFAGLAANRAARAAPGKPYVASAVQAMLAV